MGQLIFPHGNSKKKSNLKITIMKRSFFALLAAAVSGLASCQQDGTQDDAALPMNVYSFDATTEGTRVSLDHTALTYTWDGSEQVMVWYAPAASAPDYDYTLIGDPFVAESAGAETAFSLRTEYDLGEMGYDDQNYVLMYPWPYAGTSGVSGDEVTYTIGTREGDGYVQKDLKRIEVQQQFIQALIEKVCSSDTLMRNLNDLVKVALDCTESNISVSEALKYVKYVKALDPAKITSDTVPYLGNPGRYVELDEDGIKELVNERIYGIAPQSSTEEQEENQFNESNQEGNQLNEDV